MAARVALLILVTGLFAALWSGDHPDQSNRYHYTKASLQRRFLKESQQERIWWLIDSAALAFELF